jgi:hypothetical protein
MSDITMSDDTKKIAHPIIALHALARCSIAEWRIGMA